MNRRLNNKTALVTGGGSGIGESICLRLAEEGAAIKIIDINLDAADACAEKIRKLGGEAQTYACDISKHEQVKSIYSEILSEQAIDILVNSAGIAHIGNLESTQEEDLDRLYRVNIKGVFNSMQALIGAMKKRRQGVIINLASVAASVGIADRFAYSMSKGAVLTMTYSTAKDYINDGIRCNCISPGRVHTPFVDNFIRDNYPEEQDEMFEKLSKSQPIGRMAQPNEISAMVSYLCSNEAAFITGSNFPIDGGFVTLNN